MTEPTSSPCSPHGAAEPEFKDFAVGAIDLGDAQLTEDLSCGMARVETLLRSKLSTGEDFLVDKVLHLAEAGGKRFRPMFALLASQYGDRPMSENVIKAAAVVEIVHLATLYHDDVMDEAQRRRGVYSANARWGNSVAILAGDILLSHASSIMAELGVETVSHFAVTFGQLVTGQMRETVGARGTNPIEHYITVIEEKTGVLIASAGFLGGFHSGAPKEHIAALEGYGRAIGMIFQIVDDMIDIFSDPSKSGKTPGTDLREGVFTLPVLYALEEDSEVGEQLRQELTGPVTSDEQLEKVLDLLRRSTGADKTRTVIKHYLSTAQEYLKDLPDVPATQALSSVAEYSVRRVG